MGWLRDEIEAVIERASTCPGCGHSNPAGIEGCDCTRTDCACAPAEATRNAAG